MRNVYFCSWICFRVGGRCILQFLTLCNPCIFSLFVFFLTWFHVHMLVRWVASWRDWLRLFHLDCFITVYSHLGCNNVPQYLCIFFFYLIYFSFCLKKIDKMIAKKKLDKMISNCLTFFFVQSSILILKLICLTSMKTKREGTFGDYIFFIFLALFTFYDEYHASFSSLTF
jgi:hypothetical protein